METAALSLAAFVIKEGIKYSPEIKEAFKTFFSKEDPTDDDFSILKGRIENLDYFKFVKESKLTP